MAGWKMKPTHELCVFNKETEARAVVGVGWLNKKGHISIRLNECAVLSHHPDRVFSLFPKTYKEDQVETKTPATEEPNDNF